MESPCQSKDDVPMDDVPSIAHGEKYEAEVPSIVSQGTCDEEMTSVANAEKDLDFSQLSPLYAATRDFNLPKVNSEYKFQVLRRTWCHHDALQLSRHESWKARAFS